MCPIRIIVCKKALPLPDMYSKDLTFKTGDETAATVLRFSPSSKQTISIPPPLITHRHKLEDIEEAYRVSENKLGGVIQVAIYPK